MPGPLTSNNNETSEDEVLLQLLLRLKIELDFDPKVLSEVFRVVATSADQKNTAEGETSARIARKLRDILHKQFLGDGRNSDNSKQGSPGGGAGSSS
jgi:hypothetical protein